jgi:hypothetical protein
LYFKGLTETGIYMQRFDRIDGFPQTMFSTIAYNCDRCSYAEVRMDCAVVGDVGEKWESRFQTLT